MAVSRSVREIRTTLSAGVLTPIVPPASFTKVMVGNATGGDVTLYTNDDLSEYRVITTGFERELRAVQTHGFRGGEIAFWLQSAGGGLVICEWA